MLDPSGVSRTGSPRLEFDHLVIAETPERRALCRGERGTSDQARRRRLEYAPPRRRIGECIGHCAVLGGVVVPLALDRVGVLAGGAVRGQLLITDVEGWLG